MQVLVTGNLGYLGPMVVEHLRREHPDWTLRGLDAGFFPRPSGAGTELEPSALDSQSYGDVRDVTVADLRGVDALVHLAAISNDPMGGAFEDATVDINHRATVRLARTALQAGVDTFVFASSCSIYGRVGGVAHEGSPVYPLTAYARSKLAAEQDLRQVANDGLTVICLRFATACGMSPNLRLDLVLNDFVASALVNKTVRVLSNGSPWRPLIALQDMARALDWAILCPTNATGSFQLLNVGSNAWNFQVRELASAVERCVSDTTVEINHLAPADSRSYSVDFTRFARLAPHHQPAQTLDGTIEDLRCGLIGLGFRDPDIRASDWIRLHVIRRLVDDGRLTSDLRWV